MCVFWQLGSLEKSLGLFLDQISKKIPACCAGRDFFRNLMYSFGRGLPLRGNCPKEASQEAEMGCRTLVNLVVCLWNGCNSCISAITDWLYSYIPGEWLQDFSTGTGNGSKTAVNLVFLQ